MKYVIVTGANGFIGKTLVNALLEKEYRVVALDICFDDVLLNDDRVTCIKHMNISNRMMLSLLVVISMELVNWQHI